MDQTVSTVKRRHSNKPPSVKAAVVAKRVSGEPVSHIAKDLNISRPTVYAIIEETNIDKMMEDGRLGTMKRIPKALETLDVRLSKHSETAALYVLDRCFDEAKSGSGRKMTADIHLQTAVQVLLKGSSEQSESQVSVDQKVIDIQPAEDK